MFYRCLKNILFFKKAKGGKISRFWCRHFQNKSIMHPALMKVLNLYLPQRAQVSED
jgi:hypothetical protein